MPKFANVKFYLNIYNNNISKSCQKTNIRHHYGKYKIKSNISECEPLIIYIVCNRMWVEYKF